MSARPDWEAFRPHYDAHIRPGLTAREVERARLNRWRWIAGVGALAAAAAVVAYWWFAARATPALLIAAPILALFGLGGASMIGKSLVRTVKTDILTAIADQFGLEWRTGAGPSPRVFRSEGVIGNYDRVSIDDSFEAVIDGRPIALTEAHLQKRKRSRDSKGRSRVRYVTVFHGLLIQCRTPGPAPTRVRLLRDGGAIGNAIGGWFRETFSDDERIRLEDPVFEKRFEVYADDQLAARLLLTPTALEAITAFSDAAPSQRIQMAFNGTALWLAIDSRHNGFETGGLSGRLDDPERAKTVVEEIAVLWDVATLVAKMRFSNSASWHPPGA